MHTLDDHINVNYKSIGQKNEHDKIIFHYFNLVFLSGK